MTDHLPRGLVPLPVLAHQVLAEHWRKRQQQRWRRVRLTPATSPELLSRFGLTGSVLAERQAIEGRARGGDPEATAELWRRWRVRVIRP